MDSALMLGGGKPLTIAGALALLFNSAPASIPLPTPGAPIPSTGLSGWWDASNLAGGQVYNTLTDGSGNNIAASTGGAKSVAHTAGQLAGLYPESSYWSYPFSFSYMHPFIANYAVNASNVKVGAGGNFTVFLVWSRATQPQAATAASTATTADVPLVSINGTVVLSMTSRGDGTDTLKLFPTGTTQTAGLVGLRHTHCVRMVYSGTSVDLWLDGVKLISNAPTTTLGATATLSLLNGAQLIFHEAATWSHALSTQEHSDLSSYAQRWPLGPRQAINGMFIGQSNAGNFIGGGNFIQVYKKLAYLTGCLSCNLLFNSGAYSNIPGPYATMWSGQGDYIPPSTALFLDPSKGGDPSTWPIGPNGQMMLNALDAMTPDQKANFYFVARFWSESDSGITTPAAKATYFAAMKREMQLVRTHLGKTPAQLPYFVISALPFAVQDEYAQTHREVMQDLVNDPTLNVHFMLTQAGDAVGQLGPDTTHYDSTTGIESGTGNGAHRDNDDLAAYAYRFCIPIARAVMDAQAIQQKSDVITVLDASLPKSGGPTLTAATYEGTTIKPTGSVLVTLTHDKGTDLLLPLRAPLGVGWSLMDGVSDTLAGNLGTPGTMIQATACEKVSSTQLRITLASPPLHPAKAQMYYGYGSNLDSHQYAIIGRGNAVTDNFGSVALPAGWKIGADMADDKAQVNNPLQATSYGVMLS